VHWKGRDDKIEGKIKFQEDKTNEKKGAGNCFSASVTALTLYTAKHQRRNENRLSVARQVRFLCLISHRILSSGCLSFIFFIYDNSHVTLVLQQ
jgi:hypothetical protein